MEHFCGLNRKTFRLFSLFYPRIDTFWTPVISHLFTLHSICNSVMFPIVHNVQFENQVMRVATQSSLYFCHGPGARHVILRGLELRHDSTTGTSNAFKVERISLRSRGTCAI